MIVDPGSQFRDWISGEVERIAKRLIGNVQAPIASQQEGVPASDGHRVLNFQGAGVAVSDDSVGRRTNIFIPGATIGGRTTSINTTAGHEKVFPLGTVPTNWQTTGFSDAGWSASVLEGFDESTEFTSVPGAQWVTATSGTVAASAEFLIRKTFQLPSGTINTATLLINTDDWLVELYVNGTAITVPTSLATGSTGHVGYASISIDGSLLTAGGANNVIAARIQNHAGTTSPYAVTFGLNVTIATTSTGQQNALSANVTMTNANQYYDGPSLTLPPGNWFLVGAVSVTTPSAALVEAKLWDGTTVAGSLETTANGPMSMTVVGSVSPAVTTTYKVSVAATVAGGSIRAAAASNSAGNTASTLAAIQI